jgi:hypothetical protein
MSSERRRGIVTRPHKDHHAAKKVPDRVQSEFVRIWALILSTVGNMPCVSHNYSALRPPARIRTLNSLVRTSRWPSPPAADETGWPGRCFTPTATRPTPPTLPPCSAIRSRSRSSTARSTACPTTGGRDTSTILCRPCRPPAAPDVRGASLEHPESERAEHHHRREVERVDRFPHGGQLNPPAVRSDTAFVAPNQEDPQV